MNTSFDAEHSTGTPVFMGLRLRRDDSEFYIWMNMPLGSHPSGS